MAGRDFLDFPVGELLFHDLGLMATGADLLLVTTQTHNLAM